MTEHDADCLSNDGGRHCDCQGLVRRIEPAPPTHDGPCVESLDGDGEPLGYCVTCYQPTYP